ncbi:MAG: STAS/SEC14 domain-containing protein [Acidobacteriota bacterium]
MLFKISLLESKNLLYVGLTGNLTVADLMNLRKMVLNFPGYVRSLNTLLDLRFIEGLRLTAFEIRYLADTAISNPGTQCAIVTDNQLAFANGRMYSAFSESKKREVRVFRLLESACQWLHLCEKDLDLIHPLTDHSADGERLTQSIETGGVHRSNTVRSCSILTGLEI